VSCVTFVMPDNSLYPFIWQGYEITVDISQREPICSGSYYGLVIDGEATLRRIYRLDHGGFWLWADRSGFIGQEVPESEIGSLKIIGRAVTFQGSFLKPVETPQHDN